MKELKQDWQNNQGRNFQDIYVPQRGIVKNSDTDTNDVLKRCQATIREQHHALLSIKKNNGYGVW